MTATVIDLQSERFNRAATSDYDRIIDLLSEHSTQHALSGSYFLTIRDTLQAARVAFTAAGVPNAYVMLDMHVYMGRLMPTFVFSSIEFMCRQRPDYRVDFLKITCNFSTMHQVPADCKTITDEMVMAMDAWQRQLTREDGGCHPFSIVNQRLLLMLLDSGFQVFEFTVPTDPMSGPFRYALMLHEYVVHVEYDLPALERATVEANILEH